MFPILNQQPVAGGQSSFMRKRPVLQRSPWYRSPKLIRHGVMLFFFVFLVRVAYHHKVLGGGPNGSPSVEAYCPFGGIETMYQFVTTGGFIRRIEPSALILLAAVMLLTLVASRGLCGWICPFGSLQEWIGMLGRRLLGKRFNPTGAWDRLLRPLKYVILVAIIALTWWTGSLVFRDYDPFLAFFHLGGHMEELKWAYAVLAAVLAGSLVIDRFFCKYACPLGAVIGIVGKVGITRIERDTQGCKECNLCQKKCPSHVAFLPHRVIRSVECNHCLDCVVDCPKPNVLSVRGFKLRFSHAAYAALLLSGFLGLVGISQLSGKWRTKPERLVATGAAGERDAGAIRGWMSLREIGSAYKIPLDELYQGVGLDPAVPPDARLNKIGEEYKHGFSPEVLREFVDARLASLQDQVPSNRPSAPVEKEGAAALPVPQSHNPQPKPQEERFVQPPDRIRGIAASPKSVATEVHVPLKPAHRATNTEASKFDSNGQRHGANDPGLPASGEDQEVKGFMTLNEIVLKTGVPKAFLLKTLELPEDIPGAQPVRSWMHDRGKSISDLRDAVAAWRAQQNQ